MSRKRTKRAVPSDFEEDSSSSYSNTNHDVNLPSITYKKVSKNY